MLFDPDAFEPLAGGPWDEEAARRGIRAIAARTEEGFEGDRLWPADEWDAWTLEPPLSSVYVGAAGIALGLDLLRRRGIADTRLDPASVARRALARWRSSPELAAGVDLPPTPEASLLCGEAGILLAAWRVTGGETELADALHAHVLANAGNPAREVMWGSPGTMVAARAMHAWTGEERWGRAWRGSADELLRRRDDDGLWTQELYGDRHRQLGPVHGMTGNVAALLGGGELLGATERLETERLARAALARTAIVEDGLATWPAREGGPLRDRHGEIRLQWCHGAPGIVAAAAPYLDEELLLAGAELTWRAGAHGAEKGAGLCHGTAGNGYALLRAFERLGDELWLARARAFAMHALHQALAAPPRHSLFTGHLGAALFASDCLDATPRYPLLGGP